MLRRDFFAQTLAKFSCSKVRRQQFAQIRQQLFGVTFEKLQVRVSSGSAHIFVLNTWRKWKKLPDKKLTQIL
jgi:hypothetical protein